MDPLAEHLAEELRAAAGRRQRLLAVECDDALLEIAPQMQSDPNRRRRLLELLTELQAANMLTWSVSRDRSVRPELPAFITLAGNVEDERQAAALPNLPWRPELEWAYNLRLTPREHEVLSVVQAYRRDRDPETAPIPHRERSLLLFRDEKRIDRLVRSRLFEPGYLSLELLDAYWAGPPIAFANTGGSGPVVVSENAASWHTLVKVLDGQARAVAYGAGGAFAQSVAWLASIGDLDAVLYIGDLDAEGVAIPQRAATAAELAGVPTPQPYPALWRALADLAPEHGQPGPPVPTEVAQELCTWFSSEPGLARDVQRLIERGVRVPQEALTTTVLTSVERDAPAPQWRATRR